MTSKEKTSAKHVQAQAPISRSIRGSIFVGVVKSAKAPLTVTVEKELVRYVSKFERYKKDKAVVKAHNPPEINAGEGDLVKVGETRKISKTKSFVVVEILRKAGAKRALYKERTLPENKEREKQDKQGKTGKEEKGTEGEGQ